jgi:hypothetical protein
MCQSESSFLNAVGIWGWGGILFPAAENQQVVIVDRNHTLQQMYLLHCGIRYF